MSLCNEGGASSGEVLRAATQVVPTDFESIYTAFIYFADHIKAIADGVNATQDPIGTREAYFRAATYYRAAAFYLIKNWSDSRNYELWDKALDTFNKAMALMEPIPGERFTVKAHSPSIGDFDVNNWSFLQGKRRQRIDTNCRDWQRLRRQSGRALPFHCARDSCARAERGDL